jgi:hypothetical protein
MFFFVFVAAIGGAIAMKMKGKDNIMYIMGVLTLVFDCLGWTGILGGQSRAACDVSEAAADKFCDGYNAGISFFVFAAVVFGVMAYLIRPGQEVVNKFSIMSFFTALGLYAIANSAWTAGLSGYNCEFADTMQSLNADDGSFSKGCGGYGFASFLFMCGFIAVIAFLYFTYSAGASVASLWKYTLIYLCIYYIAYMVYYGTSSNMLNSTDDDIDNDQATGYGFASFFLFLCFLALLIHAILPYVKPEFYGKYKHPTFFLTLCLWSLALSSTFGGLSKTGCDAGDDDASKNMCDGFAMATFFSFVNFVVCIAPIYFAVTDSDDNVEEDDLQVDTTTDQEMADPNNKTVYLEAQDV